MRGGGPGRKRYVKKKRRREAADEEEYLRERARAPVALSQAGIACRSRQCGNPTMLPFCASTPPQAFGWTRRIPARVRGRSCRRDVCRCEMAAPRPTLPTWRRGRTPTSAASITTAELECPYGWAAVSREMVTVDAAQLGLPVVIEGSAGHAALARRAYVHRDRQRENEHALGE